MNNFLATSEDTAVRNPPGVAALYDIGSVEQEEESLQSASAMGLYDLATSSVPSHSIPSNEVIYDLGASDDQQPTGPSASANTTASVSAALYDFGETGDQGVHEPSTTAQGEPLYDFGRETGQDTLEDRPSRQAHALYDLGDSERQETRVFKTTTRTDVLYDLGEMDDQEAHASRFAPQTDGLNDMGLDSVGDTLSAEKPPATVYDTVDLVTTTFTDSDAFIANSMYDPAQRQAHQQQQVTGVYDNLTTDSLPGQAYSVASTSSQQQDTALYDIAESEPMQPAPPIPPKKRSGQVQPVLNGTPASDNGVREPMEVNVAEGVYELATNEEAPAPPLPPKRNAARGSVVMH